MVDKNFTGQLSVSVSATRGVAILSPGEVIACLLVLPCGSQHVPLAHSPLSNPPTGPLACLALPLHQHPMLSLTIQGKTIQGLLDTGADKTIIRQTDWPKGWPLDRVAQTLRGLGIATSPSRSAATLTWQDPEGRKGSFQPYVLDIPVTLWGRDVLDDMGFVLTNEPHPHF